MAKIYYTKAGSAQYYVKHAQAYLSAQRYQKFQRLHFEDDKLRCLAAGMLLRKIFGEEKVENIRFNAYGKPYIENGMFFSLAHSGEFVVLAVDASPVGIDIELRKKREYMGIAGLSLHPKELEQLQKSADQEKMFYSLWVLKESFVKQKGVGFHMPLKSFYFDLSNGVILHTQQQEKERLYFYLIDAFSGYMAALCTRSAFYDKTIEYIPLS